MSVVGGIMMFGSMFDVFAWGMVVSLFAMGLAFLAEGRGAQAIRVLLGIKAHTEHIDLYATLEREEGDWQILGALSEIERADADRAGLRPVEAGRR
jgi:hypothetical protein